MDTTNLFLRIASDPTADLARGVSYTCGAFGDDDQAHAGLSSYALVGGVECAVERLDRTLGVAGDGRDGTRYVVAIEGAHVGCGPDGEDLVAPRANVLTIDCATIRDAAHLVELLADAGISDAD